MPHSSEQVDRLQKRLEELAQQQLVASKEIDLLREEIRLLKSIEEHAQSVPIPPIEKRLKSDIGTVLPQSSASTQVSHPSTEQKAAASIDVTQKNKDTKGISGSSQKRRHSPSNLEKFIGENLASKIGIMITVIGIAIGVKYSIDHDLVSPFMRIILGYSAGIGLLGLGVMLKDQYDRFSAVLVSGGIASMYFVTYAAHTFFGIIPQTVAFVFMVAFTGFTVVAALYYNQQIIAHIGMVGAYAIPLLLQDDAGKIGVFFSYIAIINAGILVTAFVRYWKPLYYVSFGLTWLIFLSWYSLESIINQHFELSLTFLSIYFLTFYATILSYKLRKGDMFHLSDIILLLINSFIFFGVGVGVLNNHDFTQTAIARFAIGNAMIHLIVAIIIYRQKLADQQLFYFVAGLVLVFITIAVPIQFEGDWVTLLWLGEGILLFWIGRTKGAGFYEKISFPIMILAFINMINDWILLLRFNRFQTPDTIIPLFLNPHFLTSIVFLTGFGLLTYLNVKYRYRLPLDGQKKIYSLISIFVPGIFIFSAYMSIVVEISLYWDQAYALSNLPGGNYRNESLWMFKHIWMMIYSLTFVSAMAWINIRSIRSAILGMVNLRLIIIALGVFLMVGLWVLGDLQGDYINPDLAHVERGIMYIGIRYVALLSVGLALYAYHNYTQQPFMKYKSSLSFDIVFHISLLTVLSNEIFYLMELFGDVQHFSLILSILWGVYALALIVIGVWKKKKHLRIGAIVLFVVTLGKLFVVDFGEMDTIARTIVLISLGILLLLISFLYNKCKNTIYDEVTD